MIELIAVIIILSVILTIAAASVTYVLNKNKDKALEAKKSLILKQAKELFLDDEGLLLNSPKNYGNFVCQIITVETLVDNGYLDADDNDLGDGSKDVVNPKTKESMMNMKIIAYIKSSKDPSSSDYNSYGKYIGNIITIFDDDAESKCY